MECYLRLARVIGNFYSHPRNQNGCPLFGRAGESTVLFRRQEFVFAKPTSEWRQNKTTGENHARSLGTQILTLQKGAKIAQKLLGNFHLSHDICK